jgi:hypothetical protein
VEKSPNDDEALALGRLVEQAVELGQLQERLDRLRRRNFRLNRVNLVLGLVDVTLLAVILVFLTSVPWYVRALGMSCELYLVYLVTLVRQRQKVAAVILMQDGVANRPFRDPVLAWMNDAAASHKDLVDATAKLLVPVVVALIGIVYLVLK